MSRSCGVRSDLKMKWANPKIEVRLGQMPSGWDREVIFFANLRSIFYRNQSQTQVLAERVKGLECYGGRLIPILNLLFRGRNNLLVLEAPPAESLVAYFEHHLELSLPSLQILPHADYQELVKNRSDSCVAALLTVLPAQGRDLVREPVEFVLTPDEFRDFLGRDRITGPGFERIMLLGDLPELGGGDILQPVFVAGTGEREPSGGPVEWRVVVSLPVNRNYSYQFYGVIDEDK